MFMRYEVSKKIIDLLMLGSLNKILLMLLQDFVTIMEIIVYGFCILTFRCYEQIKFNLASHKVNCKIVGIGPGYSFPYDGPTHRHTRFILMYLIPEMEVFNIADNNLSTKFPKTIR